MSTPVRESLSFPRQQAATRRFTLGSPRNLAITPDGTAVYFLRSKHGRDPVLCFWSLDIASGNERLLLDPSALGTDEAELSAAERARRERARESSSGIVRYSTDTACTRAVMEVGGSIALVELTSGETRTLPAADGLFDARIDPTGRRCAYVADRSLRVIDLDDGSDNEIAGEPDPLVSWGRADFIAAEEMGRSRGFWWAPDGSALLATRVDDTNVARWWIADPAHPGRRPEEIRYPAAGTTNPAVTLAHFDVAGERTDIAWAGGDQSYEYLADVVWTDHDLPLVVRQTRDQRTVSIASVDTETAALTERRRITDPTWVELIPGSPTWCDAGLVTIEDRADHDRRMLCVDGRPVDLGDLHVRSIVGVDGTEVTVTVWTDPTEIHVVSADVARQEPSVRAISHEPGVHQATVAGDVVALVSATPVTVVPSVRILEAGHVRAEIDVRIDPPVISARPEFLRLGDRELAAALFLPDGHDGRAPLPVLLDPYGGPHAQRVTKNHLGHLTSQWFADQGFAVLVVDNRGAPGRGPAFERTVWGDLAAPVLEDQLDALDAAAARYPFLDLGRVGIRGWSFGGYLAALAALRAPDRIHAAVAGAPVTDWCLYDTHYTERYLGHPGEHPEHYQRTDLTAEAGSLTRPLLLIHGLADDNVVAAHTLQLSSALLAAGRNHSVLPLSGVTHMTPQEVVAENLLHLQRDFLREHLASPVVPG
jgi:dipeptidyl-peptidase-4